ncbi:MAG: hypothetical protein ITG03_05205 [Sphingorhabdus sp.]|jgi:hypothetical protein|nr:hypothetical protein [Sphingorhabdus sp.]
MTEKYNFSLHVYFSAVLFIQYPAFKRTYQTGMEQADILENIGLENIGTKSATRAEPLVPRPRTAHAVDFRPAKSGKVIAAGLFGYSIRYGRIQSFAPMTDYIRELEQLPNFTPPSIERFVAQYVKSNIGITRSSS